MIILSDIIACPVCGYPCPIREEDETSLVAERCPTCRVSWEWLKADQALIIFDEGEEDGP